MRVDHRADQDHVAEPAAARQVGDDLGPIVPDQDRVRQAQVVESLADQVGLVGDAHRLLWVRDAAEPGKVQGDDRPELT